MARNLLTQTKTLVGVLQAQQLPFLAAAIAYYAFLSIVPLLIVAVTIATAIAGQALANQIVTAFDEFLTPEAASIVEDAIIAPGGRGGATVLGIAVLLWSALRIFRGLDIAFSRVYGISRAKPITEQVTDAMLVLLGIATALITTILASAALPLGIIPFSGILTSIGLLVVLSVVFLPLYYVFPAKDVTVSEAIPGAVFAAIGWTVLSTLFGVYTTHAGIFQLYGVLGGVLLLLIWFYFGGLIMLLGVALNAIIAGRYQEPPDKRATPDRQVQQDGDQHESQRGDMSESDSAPDEPRGEPGEQTEQRSDLGAATLEEEVVTQADIDELRERIDRFEDEIEDRTVHRAEVESDLKRYVRRRVRRGKARGWGPYLVLLYGTIMTLGAFYFLSGGWAVGAMIVIWLSTLGLYTLMVIVGLTFTAASVPSRLFERIRSLR